jgi:DNA polymerase I-like protein with 3'-5' exonuclease and polymerase domains
VLADDPAVIQAYSSGDPYTVFGIMAGLIPPGGTKASHPNERAIAKTLMLAVQYGMSAKTLAVRLGVSLNHAKDLLAVHRQIFRRLWKWSDAQVSAGRWTGVIETVYGWRLAVNGKTKARTLRNFKVQGAGAEILRLASIFLHEAGIRVCAPVHDAFLIECPESDLAEVAQEAQRQMTRASKYVLNGYELRTESRILRHPERLIEPRGKCMWNHVRSITDHLESRGSVGLSLGRNAAHKE